MNQKVMIDSFSSYNRKHICLLASRLRTDIKMQVSPFIVSFPTTQQNTKCKQQHFENTNQGSKFTSVKKTTTKQQKL